MKKLLLIVVLALVAGAFGYAMTRVRMDSAQPEVGSGADIAWIKNEFNLDEASFAAIRELHLRYSGVCAKHCADIIAARNELARLQQDHASPAAIEAAQREFDRLKAVCNDATRMHIRAVAKHMPLEQGVRFIRATEPHLADAPHDGARVRSR